MFQFLNSDLFVKVKLPDKARVKSEWVWTLKIIGVENIDKPTERYRDEDFINRITVTKAQDNV